MTAILIAIPCQHGQIHSYTANALFSLGKLLDKKGIVSDIITPSGESGIPWVRNKIADTFLLSAGFTHLMCIDSDILFHQDDVLTLLEMNTNFAAAKYRLKTPEVQYCTAPNLNTTADAVTEVAHVGGGFQLLKRELFEALIKSGTIPKLQGFNNTEIWDFYRELRKDGTLFPEDISFCMKCTRIGEKVMIDNRIQLGHYGGMIYG